MDSFHSNEQKMGCGGAVYCAPDHMVSKEEIKKIARLSRLEIQEQELGKFTEQMNQILEFIASLNKLDTSKIEPTSHANASGTAFREDEVVVSKIAEQVLETAPDSEDNFFKVPKVIG